jgi:hypothetical protein
MRRAGARLPGPGRPYRARAGRSSRAVTAIRVALAAMATAVTQLTGAALLCYAANLYLFRRLPHDGGTASDAGPS